MKSIIHKGSKGVPTIYKIYNLVNISIIFSGILKNIAISRFLLFDHIKSLFNSFPAASIAFPKDLVSSIKETRAKSLPNKDI